MHVTIMTDASWCPTLHVGGYGFWAVSARGGKGGGGKFKDAVLSSNEAEMKAICLAIYNAYSEQILAEGDIALIQTDSEASILGFQGRRDLKDGELAAQQWLTNFSKTRKIMCQFRHVKGHSNVKDSRSVSNKLCDQRARSWLKKARKQVNDRR